MSGIIKLADGTDLPSIKDGTFVELLVPDSAIGKIKEKSDLTDGGVLLLSKGEALWARVNSDPIPEDLKKFRVAKTLPNGSSLSCVQLYLNNDLRLVEKTKKPSLDDCECFIPALNEKAESVNEAYTKISVAFEPKRRSHTGNVFSAVFVGQGTNVVPIETLRRSKLKK